MPFTSYLSKQILDWTTGAAAATQPPGRWLQFATGSPNDAGASDGPFSPRITVSFAAANSPQGSATSLNAATNTATAAGTALGWNLYDRSVGGTRIAYGTFSAGIGCKSADNPAIGAGALTITLG
jgi:hypothetical protein